ncbi:MAG TPA: histidine--tRNA ligase family protein, partial [Planctomycetaceae bacterium]|nr:histidine--tRNA ligase family protein [Planctomycetaceae bacterium]
MIQPRTLQGFRDFLPDLMLARESILDRARAVFRSFGFAPIDTPSLEYLEILTGKGGEETDRQLYRFEDHGGRQVGLRFDLTVPLARFAAQHIGQLGTPFKRYHLGTVWRGERAQRGRYREFMQCDFDTIGTTSLVADIEIVQVIYDLLRAIGVERFRIHINNRKVLNGLLERFALEDRTAAVLRAIDKLPKIGREAVEAELRTQAGLTTEQAERVLALSE